MPPATPKHRSVLLRAALCAVAVSCAAPARADIGSSLGGGVLLPSEGPAAAGIVGTVGLGSFPVIPIRPQISGVLALGPAARYAITGEAQFGGKTMYAGAGAGIGRFRTTGSQTGFMLDAFAGLRVAPFTTLQLRLYGSPNSATGGTTYFGLSFGL